MANQPIDDPLGHAELIDRIVDGAPPTTRAITPGVWMVTGPPGVGKTALLGSVGRRLAERGCDVESLAGMHCGEAVPLAPFAHLLGPAPADDRHDQLVRLRSSLAHRAREGYLVLVLDDAHLLDDMSTVLMHHLVMRDGAGAVMGARSTETVPEDIRAFGRTIGARSLELAPLDRNGSDRLVRQLVGESVPISGETLKEIWRRTRGTPGYIRQLVCAAIDHGTARNDLSDPCAWSALPLPPSLMAAISDRLRGLGAAREVAAAIGLVGALPEDLLVSTFGGDLVRRAISSGVVRAGGSSSIASLDLANAAFLEAAVASTSGWERRRLAEQLLGALESDRFRRPEDALLRADLCRLSGRPDALAFLASAGVCLAHHDSGRALDDATTAVESGGGGCADLQAAKALSQLRRWSEADRAFDRLEITFPEMSAALRNARVDALVFDRAEVVSAQKSIARWIDSGLDVDPAQLLTHQINIRAFAGDANGVVGLLDQLTVDSENVSVGAPPGALWALAAMGRPEEVLRQIRRFHEHPDLALIVHELS